MIVTHISFMYDVDGIMEKKHLGSKHSYFTSTSTWILDEGHQSASQGESTKDDIGLENSGTCHVHCNTVFCLHFKI